MHNEVAHAEEHGHHDAGSMKTFGFWSYLMTDCILFGTLFATYAVLSGAHADGPSQKDIFELSFVLVETFLLLFSSITYGFAMIAQHHGSRVAFWAGWRSPGCSVPASSAWKSMSSIT